MISSYLLKNDSLGVRSTSKGIGLPSGAQVSLLVVLVGPDLPPAVLHVLPGGPDTCGLAHFRLFSCKKRNNTICKSGDERKRK